jgi:hypothetical protein
MMSAHAAELRAMDQYAAQALGAGLIDQDLLSETISAAGRYSDCRLLVDRYASASAGDAIKAMESTAAQSARAAGLSLRDMVDDTFRASALASYASPIQDLIENVRDLSGIRPTDTIFRLGMRADYSAVCGSQFSSVSDAVAVADLAARAAAHIALPSYLEQFRLEQSRFAERLTVAQAAGWWRADHLGAFNELTAVSKMLTETTMVNARNIHAIDTAASLHLDALRSLRECRGLFDIAGLTLSRWPRLRKLSLAEKSARFRSRKKAAAVPIHYCKAYSLSLQHERVLREAIDEAMTDRYGEDWPQQRLALCGCKDLLGKWEKRGGFVLDHADFPHYERIIAYGQHFAEIFYRGFESPDTVRQLLGRARALRADTSHYHPFTPNDLAELRIVWRTLGAAIVAWSDDTEIEF